MDEEGRSQQFSPSVSATRPVLSDGISNDVLFEMVISIVKAHTTAIFSGSIGKPATITGRTHMISDHHLVSDIIRTLYLLTFCHYHLLRLTFISLDGSSTISPRFLLLSHVYIICFSSWSPFTLSFSYYVHLCWGLLSCLFQKEFHVMESPCCSKRRLMFDIMCFLSEA